MGIGTIIGSLLSILIAIAVVSALAFGFVYLLRALQNRSVGMGEARGSGPAMRFVRALPLGQSERLMLVEVGEEVLLLGVAANAITLLKSWPREAAPLAEADDQPLPPGASSQLADRFRGLPGLGIRKPEPRN